MQEMTKISVRTKIGSLNTREKKAVLEFRDKLIQKFGEQFKLIVLFGSKARGDYDPESDIDLLLVVKKKSLDFRDKIYDIVMDIGLDYDVVLSLIIRSEAEYKRFVSLKTPFMQNVAREGVIVWKKS